MIGPQGVLLSITLLLLLALTGPGAALARADSFTDNEKVPTDIAVFIDCANGGAGDEVFLSGNLHILFHGTFDGSGGVHLKSHFQPQGISGYSLVTGAKYQATGETQDHFNLKVGSQFTYVNNFKIIGQGPGNNFLVHENLHLTVNANGTVTASVDNFSITCK
jgi:hypothetical protein